MSRGTLWSAFRALDIPRDRMTMHGFRAMARTILDEVLGFWPDFIEHQLAHAVRDPNGRAYNRTAFLPERRVMMQAWADYLDRLRGRGGDRAGDSRIGAFPHPNVSGDPKRRLMARRSRQPTVWRSPRVRARSSGGSADTPAGRSVELAIRRPAAALNTLPGRIAGRERPPGGGWHGRAHVGPPRCRTRHPEGGVAPTTAGAAPAVPAGLAA